jgi:hypothetical protein
MSMGVPDNCTVRVAISSMRQTVYSTGKYTGNYAAKVRVLYKRSRDAKHDRVALQMVTSMGTFQRCPVNRGARLHSMLGCRETFQCIISRIGYGQLRHHVR